MTKQHTAVSRTALPLITKIVLHVSPDLEAIRMAWYVTHPLVRGLLGVTENAGFKFIPAGKLRPRDWTAVSKEPTPSLIRAAGFESFDCGGSSFDQHVLPEAIGNNKTSSLDLLLQEIVRKNGEVKDFGKRIDVAELLIRNQAIDVAINRSDLFGEDIAPKSLDKEPEQLSAVVAGVEEILKTKEGLRAAMLGELGVAAESSEGDASQDEAPEQDEELATDRKDAASSTPHTRRHLRNMILGWNRKYPRNPEAVVKLAMHAYSCINENLRLIGTDDLEGWDARKLFRADEIVMGADGHFRNVLGADASDEEIAEAVAEFGAEVDSALSMMEKEWNAGEADYWANATCDNIRLQPQEENRKPRKVAIISCRSNSQRLGAVTRFGNTEPGKWHEKEGGGWTFIANGERPLPEKQRREKADVTVQFYCDDRGRYNNRFIISTRRGITLDRVAQALRIADLMLRDVDVTDEIVTQMTSPGNFTYSDSLGEPVQALYFANFRTCVGNNFRANPFAQRTALSMGQIMEIVRRVLGTHYTAPISGIVHDIVRKAQRASK